MTVLTLKRILFLLASAGSTSNISGACANSGCTHSALQNTSSGMGPVERRRRRKLPPIERPRSAPIHNMGGFQGSEGPNSTNSDLDPAGNGAGQFFFFFLNEQV